MHHRTYVISRKEKALFDLFCCVNELRELRSELAIMDINQIDQEIKKLHSTILEKKPQPNQVCQHFG